MARLRGALAVLPLMAACALDPEPPVVDRRGSGASSEVLVGALAVAGPRHPTATVHVGEPTFDHGGCDPAIAEVERAMADAPSFRGRRIIAVVKRHRALLLLDDGVVRVGDRRDGGRSCWRVGLGFEPAGHKRVRGDGRTPQGWYRTSDRPWSKYYGAITIHYPNADDARLARKDRRISRKTHAAIVRANRAGRLPSQRSRLGGQILIHGGGSSRDWTLGCIALDDRDLDELRAALPRGMRTHVLVLP